MYRISNSMINIHYIEEEKLFQGDQIEQVCRGDMEINERQKILRLILLFLYLF